MFEIINTIYLVGTITLLMCYGCVGRGRRRRNGNDVTLKITNTLEKIIECRILGTPLKTYLGIFLLFSANGVITFYNPTEEWLSTTGQMLGINSLLTLTLGLKNSIYTKTGRDYLDFRTIHKVFAVGVVGLSFVHTLCYIFNLSSPDVQNIPFEFEDMYLPLPRLFGSMAQLILIVISALSLPVVRKRQYNSFYYGHISCCVLYIIFMAIHRPYFQKYLLLTGIFIIQDTLGRRKYSKMRKGCIEILTDRYISVSLKDTLDIPRDKSYHLFLHIPEISKNETHPFSIIHTDGGGVELGIKAVGNFTQQIIEHVKKNRGKMVCDVRVTGIYGSVPYKTFLYSGETDVEFVFVISGIGITPVSSIFQYIKHSHQKENRQYLLQPIITFIWFCDLELYNIYKNIIAEMSDICDFRPVINFKSLGEQKKCIYPSISLDLVFNSILALEDDDDYFRNMEIFMCGSNRLYDDTYRHSQNLRDAYTNVSVRKL